MINPIEETLDILVNEKVIADFLGYNSGSKDLRKTLSILLDDNFFIPNYFDSKFYVEVNEDVKRSGTTPIVHYALHGLSEGRQGFNSDNSYFINELISKKIINTKKYTNETSINEFIKSQSIFFITESDNILTEAWFKELKNNNNNINYFLNPFFKSNRKLNLIELINAFELTKNIPFKNGYQLEVLIEILLSEGLDFKKEIKKEELTFNNFNSIFNTEIVKSKLKSLNDNIIDLYPEWLECKNKFIPNEFFYPDFYLKFYTDLNGIENAFEHYVLHGRMENRLPNRLYQKKGSSYNIEDYYPIVKRFSSNIRDEDKEKIIKLFLSLSKDFDLTESQINYIFNFTYNRYFISYYESESYTDAFNKWLSDQMNDKATLLFDVKYFNSRYNKSFNNFFDCFLHWSNTELKTSTTPIFNDVYYITHYLDLKNLHISAFEHYLNNGQFENRSPSPIIHSQWVVDHYQIKNSTALEFLALTKTPKKPSPGLMPLLWEELYNIIKNKTSRFEFNNKKLHEQIEKASNIDPRIKVYNPDRIYTMMPYNMDSFSYIRGLEKKLKGLDIVIFRDSINFGGADVVLGHLYNELKKTHPKKNIKIISFGKIDKNILSKRNIDNYDVLCLHEKFGSLSIYEQSEVAYDIINGSQCKKAINLNCGGLWQCFSDYGRILSNNTSLNAFLFCDDRDEYGNVAGYPTSYLFDTLHLLDKIYVDSVNLINELKKRGINHSSLLDKVTMVHTPFPSPKNIKKINNPSLKNIAWAGRFDFQKRPDLLIDIAKKMPDFTFHVWGKKVISSQNYNFSSVKNIVTHGLYDDITDFLNKDCCLYLYTSQWDGIPTILLDVINLEIPVIASNVGGVSEALPEWSIIEDYENVSDYVNAIHNVINNYTEYKKLTISHKDILINEFNDKKYKEIAENC